MSDTPGPWQLDRKIKRHRQRLANLTAEIVFYGGMTYRWTIIDYDETTIERGAAPGLHLAKRAATAALIRHAAIPF